MNAYLRDQLIQLAEKSDASAKECHANAVEYRKAGHLDTAIWWEGMADRHTNRAARCRAEAES